MKLIRRYGNDKIEYDLTDEEARVINAFLTNPNKGTHIDFRGEALKANQLEVVNEKAIKLERSKQQWTDIELTNWEKEIFTNRNTFNEYLINMGVWRVDKQYPDGIIIDPIKYQELTDKWNALQYVRNRRDKMNGFSARNDWIDKLKSQFKKLADKMDMNLEPKEIYTKEELKKIEEVPF